MPYIGRDLNRGNYLKLDDISSSFNGNTKTFNLTSGGTAFIPGSSLSILVSVGGVILEPETAYQINNSEITFTTAPSGSDNFFCIVLGVALGVNTVADGTVNGAQVAKPFNYDDYFHLDSTNNRVGISSSIPSVALDVNGTVKSSVFKGPIHNTSGLSTFYDLRVTNDLTVEGTTTTLDTNLIGVDRVEVGANSDSIVGVAITQSGSADIVNLFDGTTEVLTVTDGGEVGIGTVTPQTILHLHDSTNTRIQITDNGTGAASSDGVLIGLNGDDDFFINNRESGKGLKFFTGSDALRLHINSSGISTFKAGNVDGISYPLNVKNDNNDADYDMGTGIKLQGGSSTEFYKWSAIVARGDNNGEGGYSNTQALAFYTYNQSISTAGGTEKMRLDSSGNLGISTNDPQTLLHLKSDDPTLRIQRYNQSAYGDITVDTAGKITFKSDPGNAANGDGFSFTVNNSEKVGISSEGNVKIATGGKLGINGAEPQSPLDVIANASGYAVDIRGRSTDDTSEIHFCGNNSSPNYAVVGVTTTGGGILNVQVAGTQRLKIENDGNITNTGISTSYATTTFSANFTKLDLRGTNIANSNHYILSYGAGHANNQEFHMVNTLGDLVFRTGTGSDTDRLRIDTDGRISNNSREATDYGSPNLLISGNNSMFTMMGDGSINNSSYTGIKFRVAGASTGDYTKAGIFVVRQGSYNDLDMLFCFNKDANATGVSDGDERLRINSDGQIGIGTDTVDSSADVSITNASSSARVYMKSANSSDCSIYFGRMNDSATAAIRYDHDVDTLRFYGYNNSHKLYIDNNSVIVAADRLHATRTQAKFGIDCETLNVLDDVNDPSNYGMVFYNDPTIEKANGIGFFNDDGQSCGGYIIHQDKGGSNVGDIIFATSGTAETPVERLRILSNGNVGINEDKPQTTLNVRGTISTGRNVAREVGTVVDYSGQHSGTRSASNVINGKKNYENGSNDWLAPSGQRDNAYVTIDLQAQYNINRIVIYNQNEYNTSRREVKRFTLETSNDNATWTTILDDKCGKSNAHEPNPGWSFRIPGSYRDDVEFLNARYWKFTMKDFHGTDSYGGIMEIELYQEGGDGVIDEVTSGSVVAGDVYAETGAFRRLTHNGAPNTGHDANGDNGVESGLSIGLDGNNTFLALGMNGESNLPIIYKTYRINSPGNGVSATHVLMEAASTTNSIVMNGILTIFPGRAGYNQQKGFIQYGINYSAYSGNLYGDHYELHRHGVAGYSNLAIVKSGLKVQLEVTSSTAAVGRIQMIWQGQLLGHTHN